VSDLRLDPARCVIVGDQMSDIEAGAAAGLGLSRIPALPKRAAASPAP
jgi:beta-phosphoglucomutase-like phosphatase (HAD superfamily)